MHLAISEASPDGWFSLFFHRWAQIRVRLGGSLHTAHRLDDILRIHYVTVEHVSSFIDIATFSFTPAFVRFLIAERRRS